jgi:hypothetical protein
MDERGGEFWREQGKANLIASSRTHEIEISLCTLRTHNTSLKFHD